MQRQAFALRIAGRVRPHSTRFLQIVKTPPAAVAAFCCRVPRSAADGTAINHIPNKTTAYCEVIRKFLEQHWYVEVPGWLYALNDRLLELQAQYPGRVIVKPLDEHIGDLVYLKQQDYATRERIDPVVAFATFELGWGYRPGVEKAHCGLRGGGFELGFVASEASLSPIARARTAIAPSWAISTAQKTAESLTTWSDLSVLNQYSLHTSSWEELNAGDLIGSEAEFAKWGLKTCTLDDIKVAKAPFAMPISITPRFLEWTVRRLETRC
ncbi:hypothetical protein PRNP1_001645 [Phytophthora ramorum]